MSVLQKRTLRSFFILSVIATTLGMGWAMAQYDDDPPMEAARLSFAQGSVSVQQSGSDDWAQANVNFPLGPGDRLFVDQDGVAEIQIGRTYVRVGAGTDLSVVEISPRHITLGVAQGSVHVHTFGFWPGQELIISTTSGALNLGREAEFRADVYPDQQATVFTNFSGATHAFAAGGFSTYVGEGSSLQMSGVNPVYTQWLEPNQPDQLDNWSVERDQQLANSVSSQYVSAEMPGYNDLDANGDWMPDTPYGPVWFPNNVPYGWAPYRYGHWMNRPFWGWVWVEDEQWGYAPFHYGRWVVIDGRWGWLPGPPTAHPIWSPALVVFAGGQFGGGGVSVWFPLGPGEAYRPWYHCSPRYVDQVNITNIRESRNVHVQTTYVNLVNVTNITYVNQRVGVTAMRHEDFAAGRGATKNQVHIDPKQMEHIQILDKPVPEPPAKLVILNKPTHTVPVATTRPLLINTEGKQVKAELNAKPIEPPVQQSQPKTFSNPLPNRKPAGNQNGGQNFGQPNNGHPNNGLPNNGQPNNGVPNNGLNRNGQPNNGLPNNGLPNNGHPNNGLPNNGVPNNNQPNGGHNFEQNTQPKVNTPPPPPPPQPQVKTPPPPPPPKAQPTKPAPKDNKDKDKNK
jgi:hypothetical protein